MRKLKVTKNQVILGSAFVGTFSAGAGLGYVLTRRNLKAKYESWIAQELEEARQFYSTLNKKEEYSDPVELAAKYEQSDDGLDTVEENLTDFVTELGYVPPIQEDVHIKKAVKSVKKQKVDKNIFKENELSSFNGTWNQEEEEANRTEEAPYILHHDEFMHAEVGYKQLSLTYFEGDDVLVDDEDRPIEEVESTVGNDNLLKFGHGSKDNNVLYIRNDRMELDFEVIRTKSKYTVDVLGYIEHSDRRTKIRKFRGDDE